MYKSYTFKIIYMILAFLVFAYALFFATPAMAEGEVNISLRDPVMLEGKVLDSLGNYWVGADSVVIRIFDEDGALIHHAGYDSTHADCWYGHDSVMVWSSDWWDIDTVYTDFTVDGFSPFWEFGVYTIRAQFWWHTLEHTVSKTYNVGGNWWAEEQELRRRSTSFAYDDPNEFSDGILVQDMEDIAFWWRADSNTSTIRDWDTTSVNGVSQGNKSVYVKSVREGSTAGTDAEERLRCRLNANIDADDLPDDSVYYPPTGLWSFDVFIDTVSTADGDSDERTYWGDWWHDRNGDTIMYCFRHIRFSLTGDADSSFTNGFTYTWPGNSLVPGWQTLTVNGNDFMEFGSPLDYGKMQYAQFEIMWDSTYCNPATLCDDSIQVHFDNLRYNARRKPFAIIGFHDSYVEHFYVAAQIMKAFHFRGVLYTVPINIDSVGGDAPLFMNLEHLDSLYQQGWDVAGHSLLHGHHAQGWPWDYFSYVQSIDEGQAWLLKHGFTRSAAYYHHPWDDITWEVVQILKRNHIFCAGPAVGLSGHVDLIDRSNEDFMMIPYLADDLPFRDDIELLSKTGQLGLLDMHHLNIDSFKVFCQLLWESGIDVGTISDYYDQQYAKKTDINVIASNVQALLDTMQNQDNWVASENDITSLNNFDPDVDTVGLSTNVLLLLEEVADSLRNMYKRIRTRHGGPYEE